MASNGYEELLKAWFLTPKTTEQKHLTETDIRDIAQVLQRASHQSWCRIPRIYSVLRIIGQLQAIESFIAEEITDVWFPFSQRSLPESFRSPSARLDFLDAQQLVFNTKALNLEREHTRHGHFPDETEIPLKTIGELGKGGYGFVDRVVSTISHREYARKRIPRGRAFKKDKQVLREFERELSNLKRLSKQHTHIIELIGSYTDSRYVGIIMLPVAEHNLQEYLALSLGDGEISLLRTFFGCLTSALCFLHDSRIRHKDIKPQNVLVKSGHVFLTDFGVSLDWTELNRSTTSGPTQSTPRYRAPEVAEQCARNTSSDIWSLGCVFLEIWTVLRRQTTQALRDHMVGTGTLSSCYCSNLASVNSWIEILQALPGPSTDNVPSEWIAQMLQHAPKARWTAHILLEHIRDYSSDPATPFAFAELCCLEDDGTAESVDSSIEEDMNGTTLRPTTSSNSNPSTSNPHPPSGQNVVNPISEVSIPLSAPITPHKTIQTPSHQTQSSSSSSTDLERASPTSNTSDPYSRVRLPSNQQPYVEDETKPATRETHSDISASDSPYNPSPEHNAVEHVPSQEWVFYSTKTKHLRVPDRPPPHPPPPKSTWIHRNKSSERTKDKFKKETNIRASKTPIESRRTSGEDDYTEFDSDDSTNVKINGKGFRNPRKPSPSNSVRYTYEYTPTGIRRIPRKERMESSDRNIPNEHIRLRGPLSRPQMDSNKSSIKVECRTCMYDNLPANEIAKLNCGHTMCHECLSFKFRLDYNDPQRMPTCCSSDPIPLKFVKSELDDKIKRMWKDIYQLYTRVNIYSMYCPIRGCGKWINPSTFLMDWKRGTPFAWCSQCKTVVCASCGDKFHPGKNCHRDEPATKGPELQQCYNCKAVVELSEGCNHMTCRCTAQFCMICAAPWKTCNCPWFNYSSLKEDDGSENNRWISGRGKPMVAEFVPIYEKMPRRIIDG